MKVILIFLLISFSIAGCSNRAVYENIQINKRNKCLELQPPHYYECINKANKSYDEYEHERQEMYKK